MRTGRFYTFVSARPGISIATSTSRLQSIRPFSMRNLMAGSSWAESAGPYRYERYGQTPRRLIRSGRPWPGRLRFYRGTARTVKNRSFGMAFGGSSEFGRGSVPGLRGVFESGLDALNCRLIGTWKSGPGRHQSMHRGSRSHAERRAQGHQTGLDHSLPPGSFAIKHCSRVRSQFPAQCIPPRRKTALKGGGLRP